MNTESCFTYRLRMINLYPVGVTWALRGCSIMWEFPSLAKKVHDCFNMQCSLLVNLAKMNADILPKNSIAIHREYFLAYLSDINRLDKIIETLTTWHEGTVVFVLAKCTYTLPTDCKSNKPQTVFQYATHLLSHWEFGINTVLLFNHQQLAAWGGFKRWVD